MAEQKGKKRDILKAFQDAGFEVREGKTMPATVEIKKCNCLRLLERNDDGIWVPSGPPYFLARGLRCKLEDRGFQKFWYCDGKRFPIRLTDLRTLHRFDEEVRAILSLTTLYHESLGTTSARSVYDRLSGRPDR